MNRKKKTMEALTFTLLALVVVACGAPTAMPTPVAPTATAIALQPTSTFTSIPSTVTPTPMPPTATPTPLPPTPTPMPSSTSTPVPPTSTPTLVPSSTPTPAPPTATLTEAPPTPTPLPPTPTPVPLPPTPEDWSTADWTTIAVILLQSAKIYLPQIQEVKALLTQDPTNCPRLAELLDSLANAPQYKELDQILWNRRDRPGLEGQLYSFRDAYADGVNQFRLDTFRVIRNACAAGTQPTVEQRQKATDWMDLTDPRGKMQHVITNLGPAVGP